METELIKFFGQLNFRVLNTNITGLTLMKNSAEGEELLVAVFGNDKGQVYSPSLVHQLFQQLNKDGEKNILFLIVSDDMGRDKLLTNVEGPTIWLIDSKHKGLEIPLGQKSDFFGLRYGLEETINKGPKTNPWNIKEAIKDKKNFPFVTVSLIAINVIFFIVLSCMGNTEDANFMWNMGADFGPSFFSDHEYWRVITAMFMHFGFIHLAGNMIYLAFAGNQAEKTIGHLKFFLIYMLSGILSGIISNAYYFMTDQYTVSAGASGAIYGIIGIIICLTAKNRKRIGTQQMTVRIVLIIAFVLYSNFAIGEGIDVVAHIAGLITGCVLSFAMVRDA